MPTIRLISQPWDGRGQRLGDLIVARLAQRPRFGIFRASVAYVKASGILRLIPSIRDFLAAGSRAEIFVGIDGGITTRQGLELIMQHSSAAYVFNNPLATFHSKVYLFETPGKMAVAYVGSNNLTAGGLYTNYETAVEVQLDLTKAVDREMHESLSRIFTNIADPAIGNAKQLDVNLLQELSRRRAASDEREQIRQRVRRRAADAALPAIFPRTPIAPAPPIDPSLRGLIPPVGRVRRGSDQQAVTEYQPWMTFVMTLGVRDTRQQSGYSRDVFIPLAARDASQDFWGWPTDFRPGTGATRGRYQERRIRMLVRPVAGGAQIVEGIRLYYYDRKHEFRLNCGRLIEGAQPGDLLVIQKSPVGALFEGQVYEYEATIIPSGHPLFPAFERECRKRTSGSEKQWGYLN